MTPIMTPMRAQCGCYTFGPGTRTIPWAEVEASWRWLKKSHYPVDEQPDECVREVLGCMAAGGGFWCSGVPRARTRLVRGAQARLSGFGQPQLPAIQKPDLPGYVTEEQHAAALEAAKKERLMYAAGAGIAGLALGAVISAAMR